MPRNRLHLDFSLESADDRAQFVQLYLSSIDFAPNESELETISNYILWGKNSSGKNSQQEGDIKLKEWAPTAIESIEGLMETPGFQEASFKSIKEPPLHVPRTIFDRNKALQCAPPYLRDLYIELFKQIDETELIINYYELLNDKRKKPPRESLLIRFTEEQRQFCKNQASTLTQFKYLKLRHTLKDLRDQQYTYSDGFVSYVLPHTTSIPATFWEEELLIGEDISVYPAGLKTSTSLSQKIFKENEFCNSKDFTENELENISNLIWKNQTNCYIDFTNPKHVLEIYNAKDDLLDLTMRGSDEQNQSVKQLLDTLQYYESRANLTDLQKDILEQKLRHVQNFDIARFVNQKYNKTYNENYISTIFHQKIIILVAEAAQMHKEVLSNIFFPENFKKCKDCGQILLLNTDNFVRQKKSVDGFSPRCKRCEKIKRSRYKK